MTLWHVTPVRQHFFSTGQFYQWHQPIKQHTLRGGVWYTVAPSWYSQGAIGCDRWLRSLNRFEAFKWFTSWKGWKVGRQHTKTLIPVDHTGIWLQGTCDHLWLSFWVQHLARPFSEAGWVISKSRPSPLQGMLESQSHTNELRRAWTPRFVERVSWAGN